MNDANEALMELLIMGTFTYQELDAALRRTGTSQTWLFGNGMVVYCQDLIHLQVSDIGRAYLLKEIKHD